MADFQFNASLGREVELYSRVDSNDPANSAFIFVVLAEAGLESDTVLKDYDTLADLLAGASNEVTNTNYTRKSITDAALSAYTVDDTLNQILLALPAQTYTSIAAGDAWRKLLICFDNDTTGGTDANITLVTAHDLLDAGSAFVPTGDDIVIDLSGGFIYAK